MESFDILTTHATPALTDIHHRQHNIIEADNFDLSQALDSSYDRLQELARW